MKRFYLFLLFSLCSLFAFSQSSVWIFDMKNGKTIEGVVVFKDIYQNVEVQTKDGSVERFNMRDVSESSATGTHVIEFVEKQSGKNKKLQNSDKNTELSASTSDEAVSQEKKHRGKNKKLQHSDKNTELSASTSDEATVSPEKDIQIVPQKIQPKQPNKVFATSNTADYCYYYAFKDGMYYLMMQLVRNKQNVSYVGDCYHFMCEDGSNVDIVLDDSHFRQLENGYCMVPLSQENIISLSSGVLSLSLNRDGWGFMFTKYTNKDTRSISKRILEHSSYASKKENVESELICAIGEKSALKYHIGHEQASYFIKIRLVHKSENIAFVDDKFVFSCCDGKDVSVVLPASVYDNGEENGYYKIPLEKEQLNSLRSGISQINLIRNGMEFSYDETNRANNILYSKQILETSAK